ncbi:ABC transporter ATP-binding protein [Lactobacillus intestinalis]|uniref:ABC transporter ATP-binding protein n=1 Tax=Lactobacillus intestinalis TaxID=151781 RepID=A0A4S2BL54_9LACO|nr:ABC transporter ATP-binding protein [Lactobacillus intestinalis]KAI4310250.1 ABC transporter ATP-binding protein YxdL [Lactobacillus intestinalis]TGY15558.1 ABC transporter ATP-binding protein [Lactobacillus intestinalis]
MIIINKMSKLFEKRIVFENVDFSLKEGASYAIVGKSGVGKTTFLNILGGLENPTSGKVLIDDVEVNEKNLPNLRRVKFGFIFQNFGLIDNETVRENLLIGLANQNLSQHEKDVAIKKVLKELDLGNLELNQKIYTLSGGEQQRVALARIILKKAKIIFADEPTGSLDSENSNLILRHLLTDFGRDATILIATHSPEVWQKCDYVIKIKNQKSELIKNSNRRINEV